MTDSRLVLLGMFFVLALLGHGFLWTAMVNRLHALQVRRRVCDVLSWLSLACVTCIPVAVAWGILFGWRHSGEPIELSAMPVAVRAYLYFAAGAGLFLIVTWTGRTARASFPQAVRADRNRIVDLRTVAGAGPFCTPRHRRLLRVPGNQILELNILERDVNLPRLIPALEGLTIVQLTDLHFTGRIDRRYFEEVVRLSLDLDPDLIAVTGDILDDVRCMDWVPETLGKLRARHGAYFILGNHDVWMEPKRLRETLVNCGLVDLGGRWMEIRVRGEPLVLAGNELPWFTPAADLSNVPQEHAVQRPLRIALCHCPDQLPWARANEVDLALAGHTHGGQFRLPGIGPLVAPSRFGVRYASGTFYAAPTTMHVSRGISAKFPLRLHCRPELTKLTLHAASSPCSSNSACLSSK